MRTGIYAALMNLEEDGEQKAKVMNLFNTYIGQVQEYVSQVANIGILIVTMLVASGYMIKINPLLFVVSVVCIPVFTFLYQKINVPYQEKNQKIVQGKEQLNHDIKQILEGFYIIKAYALEHRFQGIFRKDAENLKESEKEKIRINAWLGRVGIILIYVPHLIVPLFGGWLCMQGNITVGELTAVNVIIWYVTSPIDLLINMYKSRKALVPIQNDIETFLKQGEKEMADCPYESGDGKILMEDLVFSYDQHKKVLNHINATISSGMHAVFMGESGAGKSTLMKLLCGMESSYEGNICMDGMRLESKTQEKWMAQTAYVPQEPYAYGLSLRDNICLGKEISEERMKDILRVSCVQDYVNQLPQGLDTVIGDGGVRLSGGQMKKMAIARMLTKAADVYILDEPLSALDKDSAQRVQENLSLYLKEKTVIVVSHQNLDFWKKKIRTYRIQEGIITDETNVSEFGGLCEVCR